MGQDKLDTVFDGVFSLMPWTIGSLFIFVILGRVIGPFIDEIISDRKKIRDQIEKQSADAEKLKSQLVREMALRSEFDDWLVKEALRLQIGSLARPDRNELTGLLALIETTKQDNTAKMVRLQKEEVKTVSDEVEDVEQLWGTLREKCSSME